MQKWEHSLLEYSKSKSSTFHSVVRNSDLRWITAISIGRTQFSRSHEMSSWANWNCPSPDFGNASLHSWVMLAFCTIVSARYGTLNQLLLVRPIRLGSNCPPYGDLGFPNIPRQTNPLLGYIRIDFLESKLTNQYLHYKWDANGNLEYFRSDGTATGIYVIP